MDLGGQEILEMKRLLFPVNSFHAVQQRPRLQRSSLKLDGCRLVMFPLKFRFKLRCLLSKRLSEFAERWPSLGAARQRALPLVVTVTNDKSISPLKGHKHRDREVTFKQVI